LRPIYIGRKRARKAHDDDDDDDDVGTPEHRERFSFVSR
jgi:hypothetical protein